MRAAYDAIYFELKQLIEEGAYGYRSFLPSESTLVKRYGCAHNTVRKALASLAFDGYVQPIHGKGVRVIYQPLIPDQGVVSDYTPTCIESFLKAGERHGFTPATKVVLMERVVVDKSLAQLTHFEQGQELVHLERVRYYNGTPLARESNYFRADIVAGMTKDDAERSIYRYIEEVRRGRLVTSKRQVTVEPADDQDKEALELGQADYLATLRVVTFDGDGLLCEFSVLRQHPSVFFLSQTAIRPRIGSNEV